ncbi:DUF3617 domain-containing protein [Caulobacter sp. KR2-114]|uniref:DUF3617 domain-containing protein n=1 Tax=Caulobacter sp. KR2-114 TaxID=3400912 RepID=UPI003BFABF55
MLQALKTRLPGLTATAALALLAACHPPHKGGQSRMTLPGADTAPRKEGLWEQKVSDGKTAQVTKLCLDAGAHRAVAYLGDSLNRDLCSKSGMKRGDDGAWSFSSTCKAPGAGEVTTTGVATGDFTARYQIRLQRTQVGGRTPGVQRFVVDAEWKGPCPADMKPGDIVLANGHKEAISQVSPPKGS